MPGPQFFLTAYDVLWGLAIIFVFVTTAGMWVMARRAERKNKQG